MNNQKKTFAQWIQDEDGTLCFYYAPVGENPGGLWQSQGVAFQLWAEEGADRVPIYRGERTVGSVETYALGTSAQLDLLGFQVLAGVVGYGVEAAHATGDTQVLRMAASGLGTESPSAAYTHDEVGLDMLHSMGSGMPEAGFTGIAVPTLHSIDVYGDVDAEGNFHYVVIADNGIAASGQRTGDLTMYAGGGTVVVRFNGELSLTPNSFAIVNTETRRSALGPGEPFHVLDVDSRELVRHLDPGAHGRGAGDGCVRELRVQLLGELPRADVPDRSEDHQPFQHVRHLSAGSRRSPRPRRSRSGTAAPWWPPQHHLAAERPAKRAGWAGLARELVKDAG